MNMLEIVTSLLNTSLFVCVIVATFVIASYLSKNMIEIVIDVLTVLASVGIFTCGIIYQLNSLDGIRYIVIGAVLLLLIIARVISSIARKCYIRKCDRERRRRIEEQDIFR